MRLDTPLLAYSLLHFSLIRILTGAAMVLSNFSTAGAQPPNNQDCFGAIPMCQSTYSEANSPSGEGNFPDEINDANSCLGGGEVDGQWYTFTVQNSGQFCFSIIPNNMANDYDWAVYNLTSASCSDIYSNASLEVSCNFSGLPGVTGANGLSGGLNEPCIAVQTGQTYVLYVSNWSQSPFGYTLTTQVQGNTASIFDSTPPSLSVITPNCDASTFVISFSELVLCSSVQPGDMLITGPGGPYIVASAISAVCAAGGDQDNTFTITVSPALAAAGTYAFDLVGTVNDLCGNASVQGSVQMDIPGILVLDPLVTPSGCGDLATGTIDANAANGTGVLTYQLNGSTQVNNAVFTDLNAGTYTLTVTDANGCFVTTTVDVWELQSDMNTVLVATDATCFGMGDGTLEAITTGTGGPWSYSWTNALGLVVQTTVSAINDVFTSGPGDFTLIVTEGLVGGTCTQIVQGTIVEPTALQWITVPSDTLICLTGNATLAASAQGGTGTIQLNWTPGLAGDGPHLVSPGNTTNYTAQAEDANGCLTSITSAIVSVNPPLSFIPLEPDTECFGLPVTFIAANAAGGDGEYVYDWGAGPQSLDSATFALPVSATICVTLTDGCETPSVYSCVPFEILQTPPLVLTADTTFGCAPFTVRFNLIDTTEQASVLWDFGFGVPEADSINVVHLYPFPGNFTVGAQVTWPNGCVTDTSIAAMVRVITVPIADIFWSPNPASILEPTVHFQDLSQPNVVVWQWDFGVYGTSAEPDPVITFPNDVGGSYPVQLVVMNELGCTDTLRSVVDVLDDFLVFAPNAFTPDAQGPNETFFISGNDIATEEYHLIIFDRWGHEVFNSTERFEAWDGTEGGDALPQSVYVWKLAVHSLSSREKRELIGHVTLLR